MQSEQSTSQPDAGSRLYFRQLLSGRDYGQTDPLAAQMVNFAYAVGDAETGEAVLVDPAYDVGGLVDTLNSDGMKLVGVIGTHYHADHVGGNMMGFDISGVTELLATHDVPVHVQAAEVDYVCKTTGLAPGALTARHPGDVVTVGSINIELIHTPGHTPGSQCLLVEDRLISGDTLFLDGCGRTDLPGGDAETLYRSLTGTLSNVADNVVLCPGHKYSNEPTQLMGETRRRNAVFRPESVEAWLAMFG